MNRFKMLKNYVLGALLLSIVVLAPQNAMSQIQYGDFDQYSVFDLDYIQDGEMVNHRIRKKGDKALSLYYFIPSDLSVINETG